ncbi:hypothetical protein FNF29_00672 [Cafeteria roenbergensis]|uniref:Uncharacterized protein n=1 Tax=Cafeteria roenbergensis TaxID=33653 RepID=A0A5A8CXT4_CAFRO|nr:hypothetical protein FNF29_00672 [Cafeteria roenbergensis]|eukprot:KAA0156561.1 hypothetical protein FNF29_00672 [Cafeteria roenbergensis]
MDGSRERDRAITVGQALALATEALEASPAHPWQCHENWDHAAAAKLASASAALRESAAALRAVASSEGALSPRGAATTEGPPGSAGNQNLRWSTPMARLLATSGASAALAERRQAVEHAHTHSKGVAAAAKTVVEASASAVAAAEKAAADSISQACPAANLPAGLVKQYAAASVRAAGGSASALLTALPVLLAVAALQREGGSGSRFEADAEKRELSGNGDGDGSDALEQRPSEQAALHGLVVVHAFSPGVSVEVSIGAVDGRVVACQVHIIEPTAPGIDDLEGTSALEGDLSGDIQLATGSSGFSALDEEAELLNGPPRGCHPPA